VTIDIRTFAELDIEAPVDVVYDYRLDGDNIPSYNPHTSNIRRVDDGLGLGPGAEWRFDITLDGMGTIETFHRVVEADSPHRIRIEAGNPPLVSHEENLFTPTPSGGTHALFRMHIPVPDEAREGVPLFERLAHEQIEMELANIKRNLENSER
jgi:uncharacterized protein YndB with AHSA1/START domain